MAYQTFCSRLINLLTGFLLLTGISLSSGAVYAADAPRGMFALYEQNRKNGIPNYITDDFILLSYGMMLNKTITDIEEAVLMPEFNKLLQGLIVKLQSSENAADKSPLDYLNVLDCLLNGTDTPSAERKVNVKNVKLVVEELKKIRDAGGIGISDVMRQSLDYSQFKVRGKYTRDKQLGGYFQAMKYAGTVFFPVLASKATGISVDMADDLTEQALIIATTVWKDKRLKQHYQNIAEIMKQIFGPPDDLILEDYDKASSKKGKKDIAKQRKDLLEYAKKEGRQPQIISGLVDISRLEKGVTKADVMTGLRFFPQRFTPDSAAFQQLVFENVKEYKGKQKPFTMTTINSQTVKGFPMGLELLALLGSKDAKKRLKSGDEHNYKGYDTARSKAAKLIGKPDGMMANHLKIIKKQILKRTEVDDNRSLKTSLAFWTYTRYISLLYAKQSYTSVSKGIHLPPPERKTAYIDPAEALYEGLQQHLEKLLKIKALKNASEINKRLTKFIDILKECKKIALRELKNKKLGQQDVAYLNDLDLMLAKLTGGNDYPIIVDVHTEPNSGMVLEEGLGFPLIVSKDIAGGKVVGALFTYYEFKHPLNNRLTNEQWERILMVPEEVKKLKLSPISRRLLETKPKEHNQSVEKPHEELRSGVPSN